MNEKTIVSVNASLAHLKSLRQQGQKTDLEEENAALWETLNALSDLVLIPDLQRKVRLCVALRCVQEGLPLTLKQIDDLWQQFGDLLIAIDEFGDPIFQSWRLSGPFFIWPQETKREEIRAWFEEQYAKNGTSLAERWYSEGGRA